MLQVLCHVVLCYEYCTVWYYAMSTVLYCTVLYYTVLCVCLNCFFPRILLRVRQLHVIRWQIMLPFMDKIEEGVHVR